MPQIVARAIGAVLGKLLAESEIGRSMQAGNESVDHGPRDQVESRQTGERSRVKEALEHYSPRGAGFQSNNLRRTSSCRSLSDSAWKLSRMRCRRIGV